MKIKLEKDEYGVPIFIEHHVNETPPTKSTHWLEPDENGVFVSEDGQRWKESRAHYRPPPKK